MLTSHNVKLVLHLAWFLPLLIGGCSTFRWIKMGVQRPQDEVMRHDSTVYTLLKPLTIYRLDRSEVSYRHPGLMLAPPEYSSFLPKSEIPEKAGILAAGSRVQMMEVISRKSSTAGGLHVIMVMLDSPIADRQIEAHLVSTEDGYPSPRFFRKN